VNVGHERADQSTPSIVVQLLGQPFRFAQSFQSLPDLTEQVQHGTKLETDLKCPFQGRRARR
jgi:hypothetical protein